MSNLIEQTTPTDAVLVAEAELTILVDTVRGLRAEDFASPTDCVGWTVRDIVAHLTGAAEEAVHPTVMVRHLVKATTTLRRLPLADALTHVQVADRAGRADGAGTPGAPRASPDARGDPAPTAAGSRGPARR
jgi:hypothetical protein